MLLTMGRHALLTKVGCHASIMKVRISRTVAEGGMPCTDVESESTRNLAKEMRQAILLKV